MPQPSSTYRVQLPVPARVVVLVSGSGTLLQALLDAAAEPGYPAEVVAVGADRAGIEGLARAERAGVPTFVESVRAHPDRAAWNTAVTDTEVLIVDYKTNRPPPEELGGVPLSYRRQLALYRALLTRLYPGRRVRAFLLWTAALRLMELDAKTLDESMPYFGRP